MRESKKVTRRKYTEEFKKKVVKEHLEGQSLSQLSRIYGISPSTLGTWFATMKDEVKDGVESLIKPELVIPATDHVEIFIPGTEVPKLCTDSLDTSCNTKPLRPVMDEKDETILRLKEEVKDLTERVEQQQKVIDMVKAKLLDQWEKDEKILEFAMRLVDLVKKN